MKLDDNKFFFVNPRTLLAKKVRVPSMSLVRPESSLLIPEDVEKQHQAGVPLKIIKQSDDCEDQLEGKTVLVSQFAVGDPIESSGEYSVIREQDVLAIVEE